LLLLGLPSASLAQAADPAAALARVELNIAVEPGTALQKQQQWSQVLSEFKLASIRLFQGFENQPTIERRGNSDNPRVRITGSIASSGELTLPNRRFDPRDRAALRDWLIEQVAGPKPKVSSSPTPYGLSPEDARALRSALSLPLESSTLDLPFADAIGKVRAALSLPMEFSPAAETALSAAPVCRNELRGLAVGTALATLLKSAGTGFVPSANTGTLELQIAPLDELKSPWPVGTRATAPREDLPRYFESLNAELDNVPVRRALTAVTGKLEIPLVIDQQRLAANQIDLDQLAISVPARSWVYSLLIREISRQARLRCDLLLDDGQRPFLWVTTAKLTKTP
jgi:hypothetical protein